MFSVPLLVRFFPHEVSDLPVVIKYMTQTKSDQDGYSWILQYIMTLWLSLVCMLPFDLAQFDDEDSSTAASLQNIGITGLKKSGLERDSAALLLARLYMRWVHLSSLLHVRLFALSERIQPPFYPRFWSHCESPFSNHQTYLRHAFRTIMFDVKLNTNRLDHRLAKSAR